MRRDSALAWGRDRLGGEEGGAEARRLLIAASGITGSELVAWPERTVDEAALVRYRQLIAARAQGQPVAYLLGERGFWHFNLTVTPDTLIPRPESELLVEWGVGLMTDQSGLAVDLGCGSGAIALAIAHERPHWRVIGIDRSLPAVAVAATNLARYPTPNLSLMAGDWASALPAASVALLVTNPPYIDQDDPHLRQGDLRFEPRQALVAAGQGLAELKRIIDDGRRVLQPGGWLLLEHGWQQAAAVCAWMEALGYSQVGSRRDLAGHPRASGGRWL